MAQPYPISRETREEAIFLGDGGKDYGPFDLKIFDEEDVKVYTLLQDAVEWLLQSVTVTKTSDAAFDTFSISFAANVATTTKIKVLAARVHERSAGLRKGVLLDPDALEKELSKQGTILQELGRDRDRSVKMDFDAGAGLTLSSDLQDGDTLMKSGSRLVKGANAADIANAQANAVAAVVARMAAEAAAAAVAAGLDNRVRYDAAQTRTDAEMAQARANMGASSNIEPLKATDYGVLPSLGDMSAAITSFLVLSNALLRPAYFPAGDYNCASLISVTNVRIPIFGDGMDVSRLIFNGSTKGLKLDNSALSSNQRTVEVYGLGILTTGAGVGNGAEFIGSPGEGGELRRSISIRNCRISGLTPSCGWENVAKFTKVLSGEFVHNYCSGAATVLGTSAATKFGVLYGGGTNILDVSQNIFDWIEKAAGTFDSSSATEGLGFHRNIVRAAFWGVVAEASGQWAEVTGNHFDVVSGAVKVGKSGVSGEDFSSLQDNFVLRSSAASWGTSGSPSEFVAFDVQSNYVDIEGNTGWLDSSVVGGVSRQANTIGIRLGVLTDSTKGQNCTVERNNFSGFGKDIHILSTAKSNSVKNNRGDAFGNTSGVGVVNDGDISNIVENNQYVSSSGVVTVNNGAQKRLPYSEAYITANMVDVTGDNTGVGFGGQVTALRNFGTALNTGTMTFTAPIAGVYSFSGFLTFTDATTAHLGILRWVFSAAGDKDLSFYPYAQGMQYGFEQYMNAGETVYPLLLIRGGSKVVDVLGLASKSKFTMRMVRPD